MSLEPSKSQLDTQRIAMQHLDVPPPVGSTTRFHSVAARSTHVSTASLSNLARSLSTIRSSVALPSSRVDLEAASRAGIQVVSPETHPEAFVPLPPDGGWGWVVVLAAFLTNLVIDGIYVSFGIMAGDLSDHFNASDATVMLLGSLLLGVYQIVGPIVAGLVNRFGCRVVGIIGAFAASGAMAASAFMDNINYMMVSYGCVAGASFGVLHLPSIICVSFYFESHRALATGITSCGTPIGAMVFAPLTELLLKKYGWSNTLIIFAGMLLNCAVLAALYRPLKPIVKIKIMCKEEQEAMQTLLQLAAEARAEEAAAARAETQTAAVTPAITTPEPDMPTIASQRDIMSVPKLEKLEEEEEEPMAAVAVGGKTKNSKTMEEVSPQLPPAAASQGKHLESIAEHPEKEAEKTEAADQTKIPEKKAKQRHHRHHRKPSKHAPTKKYGIWFGGVDTMVPADDGDRSVSHGTTTEVMNGVDVGRDEEDGGGAPGSESDPSDVSICGSSCNEEGSHWTQGSSDGENEDEGEGSMEMRPLKLSTKPTGGRAAHGKKSGRASKQETSNDRIVSDPSLSQSKMNSWTPNRLGAGGAANGRRRNHFSECRPNRVSAVRRTPVGGAVHQSVVRLATASYAPVSQRRTKSMGVLLRSRLNSLGSTNTGIYASNVGWVGASAEDLGSAAPVIVQLPHGSVTVRDYSRPLYRKDIFFPGSIKRHLDVPPPGPRVQAAAATAEEGRMLDTPTEGIYRRKPTVTGGASLFGSTINFGDNVPLPPITEGSDAIQGAEAGPCLMSLTMIPLPDDDEGVSVPPASATADEAEPATAVPGEKDLINSQTNLSGAEVAPDGINGVPRSMPLCGWWLCWKQQDVASVKDQKRGDVAVEGGEGSDEEMERFKKSLMEGKVGKKAKKKPYMAVRRCAGCLSKPLVDTVATMVNMSLLKSSSFNVFCLASLLGVAGIYVPLFFVCDLADSFGIPQSQSAYLLTAYGAASVVSRLFSSWVVGRPNVSSLLVTTVTIFLAGAVVCLMPFWGSLPGQVILMLVYGIFVSPFFALTSISICDILGLDALTNAYGIVVMVRGVASVVGSPSAGALKVKTQSLIIPMLISGVLVVLGGLLYLFIYLMEHSKAKMTEQSQQKENGMEQNHVV